MPRTVKVIKNDRDEEIEIYSDICSVCSKEMIFPKNEADKVEVLFPFVKEKSNKGSPCLDCFIKSEDENMSIFTQEEINIINNAFLKIKHDQG